MSFDDNFVDLRQPNAESELVRMINTHGLATFGDISNKQQFADLAERFGIIVKPSLSDEYGGTLITPKKDLDQKTGYLGLTDKELIFHTDRSAGQDPPLLLFMYCIKPASAGGISKVVDGKKLYEKLRERHPKLLKKLLDPYAVIFRESNNQQDEGAKQYIGPVFSKSENCIVSVKFRYDHLGYFNASISPELKDLLKIMEELDISFRLEQGQAYVINNLRCLHARTAFRGNRQMYRLHVECDANSQIGQQIVRGFRLEPRVGVIGEYVPKAA